MFYVYVHENTLKTLTVYVKIYTWNIITCQQQLGSATPTNRGGDGGGYHAYAGYVSTIGKVHFNGAIYASRGMYMSSAIIK